MIKSTEHGTEGVDLARADADLGAQAELAAIIEARRGVDYHGRRIDPFDELARFLIIRRDNGFRMFRTVALDVMDRFVHVLHDAHGKDQIEIFFSPIGVGSCFNPRHQRASILAAAHLYPRGLKLGDHPWQKLGRDHFVHQQGFHGGTSLSDPSLSAFQRKRSA